MFSMLSAAVCYRDNLHIAVLAIPDNLPPAGRTILGWLAEICMILVSIFMLIWGIALVETTWPQTIAEFPALSTGITYLPIPIGGAIVLLFVIERLWTGQLFAAPEAASIAAPPMRSGLGHLALNLRHHTAPLSGHSRGNRGAVRRSGGTYDRAHGVVAGPDPARHLRPGRCRVPPAEPVPGP